MSNNDQSSDDQGVESPWSRVWKYIKGQPTEVTRSIVVPTERVFDSGTMPNRFEPRKQYFGVVINEMFLAQSRKWWSEYDPMALVTTEFTYNGKRTTVPLVVGPSMIQAKGENVPAGMAITDTLVAGVHPYAGGKFALTVILAQVKRNSYARKLLEVVENVAHAFPLGVALEPHLKVASAVMGGVDALLGMTETQPIVGHRWEYNDGITPWLKPAFFALVAADEQTVDRKSLSVVEGRLKEGDGRTAPAYRNSDFLLYSLRVIERRNDIEELPFYNLFKKALTAAASSEKGSWKVAKAGMATVFQEMLLSPDLTLGQVQELFQEFKQQLETSHTLAESFTLGFPSLTRSLDNAFPREEKAERLRQLSEIHSLLDL